MREKQARETRQANKSPMGSSLVGFKGNETKFKVII